jgi:hypothetical protein
VHGRFLFDHAVPQDRSMSMSALGQKQTSAHVRQCPALPQKQTWFSRVVMSALCQKRTLLCFTQSPRRRVQPKALRRLKIGRHHELRSIKSGTGERPEPLNGVARGSNAEKKVQLVRLGQKEIETLGLSQRFWSDLYHHSMTVPRLHDVQSGHVTRRPGRGRRSAPDAETLLTKQHYLSSSAPPFRLRLSPSRESEPFLNLLVRPRQYRRRPRNDAVQFRCILYSYRVSSPRVIFCRFPYKQDRKLLFVHDS